MTMTALPTPPSRSDDQATFSARADALLGALPGFVTEANALEANVVAKEASAVSAASSAASSASGASTSEASAASSASSASTSAASASGSASAAATSAAQAEEKANSIGIPEIGSYALLRAYSGSVTAYYVRGVANIFDGGAGAFRVDVSDTTSADNGGTILVDAAGRRWRREFSGAVDVVWFGASPLASAATNRTAIQAAIDFAKDAWRMGVDLHAGTYLIDQAIRIYTGTILRGAGVNVTFLKAADGANCGVLETDGFASLTGGTAKFVTDTGMTWGFELRGFTVDGNRQNNYGGVSGTRFGGVASAVWDGFGIRIYGRRYIIEDVNVQYCAGIGFYSECGNPSSPSPTDWYYNALNNQQGHIKGMAISQCSYEGFVFLGPGDIRIDDVTAELCFYPDETLYGTARNSLLFPTETICGMVFMSRSSNTAAGGAEIGFIHSHTHKNGYGIRFHGEGSLILRIRGENITSEGNLAGIKMHGRITGQVNKVNIRNQNYGDGSLPDFDYENLNSESFVISEYENRASTGNAGSIRLMVRNDHLQIGTVSILGGTAGHGVVLGDNVNFVLIDQLNCRDLRGTAYDGNPSRAFWTKASAAFNYVTKAVLIDNDVGWYNENTSENIIAGGVISANTTSYPSALPVQFAASPNNGALRRCKFITRNGVNSLLPDFAGAVAIDPAITTEQAITFTHSMWRTPSINEVSLSYTTNGTSRPTLQCLEVASVSATQIVAKIRFSVAGNGTTSGSSLLARVG